jgi:hypothetical protein
MQIQDLSVYFYITVWTFITVHLVWTWRFEVWKRDTRSMLDEMQKCNDDFVEAIGLLKMGAIHEAVEVAQRWRVRLDAEG